MKNIILALTLILIFVGCKSDSNERNNQNEGQVENKLIKEFVVKMKFKTTKSDEFKLVLYNIIPDEYQNKYIVINERVVLTSETDNLTANFGENISDSFRINFGNKEEKEIEILSIEISYGSNQININPEDLTTYFKFNDFVSQDPKSFKLQTKKVGEKLNPIIYLKLQYMRELKQNN